MTGTTIRMFGLLFLIVSISAAAHSTPFIKRFPYIVSIRLSGEHVCSGAIISDRHILSDAVCLINLYDHMDNVTVHTGTGWLNKEGSVHIVLQVESHDRYDQDHNLQPTVAVITLDDRIVFNKKQQKVNLINSFLDDKTTANIVGWNKTSWSGLTKVPVTLLSSQTCNHPTSRICSDSSITNRLCLGDSGAPVVSSSGELVGIVPYKKVNTCSKHTREYYHSVLVSRGFIDSILRR